MRYYDFLVKVFCNMCDGIIIVDPNRRKIRKALELRANFGKPDSLDIAAIPEERAVTVKAPVMPSIICSRCSTVGLEILEYT